MVNKTTRFTLTNLQTSTNCLFSTKNGVSRFLQPNLHKESCASILFSSNSMSFSRTSFNFFSLVCLSLSLNFKNFQLSLELFPHKSNFCTSTNQYSDIGDSQSKLCLQFSQVSSSFLISQRDFPGAAMDLILLISKLK